MREARESLIKEAFYITWTSLYSHLYWVEIKGKNYGGKKHHIKAIKDYAKLINIISKLY